MPGMPTTKVEHVTENRTPGSLEELTVDECWALLHAGSVGRLAVAIDNRPDIFPVNYLVDDGTIVIRTAPGLKLAASTLGRGVAFEVDDLDEVENTGSSVVIHGLATEVEGIEQILEAGDLGVQPWADGQKDRFIRIEPAEVTGRRISRA